MMDKRKRQERRLCGDNAGSRTGKRQLLSCMGSSGCGRGRCSCGRLMLACKGKVAFPRGFGWVGGG